jgi:hypothetical protein
MDDKRTDKNSESPIAETCQPNETKQVNIDFRELVVSLIIEVEVLKKCLVENRMITSEDFIKNVGVMREKKEITFAPKTI